MSYISAGNTTTTTLVQYGDTTGNLVFSTGGANTAALTINNAQNLQLNSATGQILNSSGNPIVTSAGTVLQVVTGTDAGTSTTSTSAANLSTTAITITPKSASSRLVIQVSFQGIITAAGVGTNSYGYYQINEGATQRSFATINMAVVSGAGTNVQVANGLCLLASVTNSALTARGFSLYGYTSTGSATCYGSSMTWMIMEVSV